jgi:membrane-associated phospholipid phosphatase
MIRILSGLALVFCICGVAPRAQAQSDGGLYRVDLRIDLPLIALGGAVSIGGLLQRSELPACAPHCDASTLNALDRSAIHFRSSGAALAATLMLPVLLIGPLVLSVLDGPWNEVVDTVIVMTEALALTQTITQLTKFSVNRYSPALFSGDPDHPSLHDFDTTRSFFSAHTSSTFSVTTAFTVSYWLRHPHNPMRFVVLGASVLLSLTTGFFTVMAGQHFWTDVAAGAVAGAAVGALVPFAHVRFD